MRIWAGMKLFIDVSIIILRIILRIMSVYSGFATRQQETFYNKLLDRMIQLLTLKLL